MHVDKHYQNAVTLMAEQGFKEFMSYNLYNWTDKPKDLYYRLRENVRLMEELKLKDMYAFPMKFQPIMKVNSERNHISKHWTQAKLNGFVALRNSHSFSGQISCHHMGEFEYWFGKNAEEFEKLISYPKIKLLAERKKSKLRLERIKPLLQSS